LSYRGGYRRRTNGKATHVDSLCLGWMGLLWSARRSPRGRSYLPTLLGYCRQDSLPFNHRAVAHSAVPFYLLGNYITTCIYALPEKEVQLEICALFPVLRHRPTVRTSMYVYLCMRCNESSCQIQVQVLGDTALLYAGLSGGSRSSRIPRYVRTANTCSLRPFSAPVPEGRSMTRQERRGASRTPAMLIITIVRFIARSHNCTINTIPQYT
jgi:hypothetical protein